MLFPGTALITPPLQVVDSLAGLATIIPEGKLSMNCRLAIEFAFKVLSMVKVRVVLPPREMEDGEKLLLNPGLSVATVRSPVAGPLLPKVEVRSPVVLVMVAAVLEVTSTLMLQEE